MTSRFTVDHEAVAAAARSLDIRDPVRVFVRNYKHFTGRYISWSNAEHRIGVAPDQSPSAASKSLWHELTHALQAERLGSFEAFDRRAAAEMQQAKVKVERLTHSRRYRRTALEGEAEANERRHRELAMTRKPRKTR